MSAEKTPGKKTELIEKVADQLLARGLQGLSLRPLAAALGTSDRMLLHYFRNKEDLLRSALTCIGARLLEETSAAVPSPKPFADVVAELGKLFRESRMRPYFRIWIDLAALSASGEKSYQPQAENIGHIFRSWLSRSLLEPASPRREALAALLMAALDGCALFEALGLPETADAAMEGLALLAGTD